MKIQKIFSNVEDPSENLYSVLMSEEEIALFSDINSKIPKSEAADKAYEEWMNNKTQENARKFLDIWSKEVYVPARKNGIFVDPHPSIVKQAAGRPLKNYWKDYKEKRGKKSSSPTFSSQKEYSLSGRLKAAKVAYRNGKEYYTSPGYKKETENLIKDLESYDPSKYFKSESAKRAAKKSNEKEISRLKKNMNNSPKKLALRDAYHAFKSPYWEDRLYSEKKIKKDRFKKLRRTMAALGNNSIDSSILSNNLLHQQNAWNSHAIGVNAHSIATMGHPIM